MKKIDSLYTIIIVLVFVITLLSYHSRLLKSSEIEEMLRMEQRAHYSLGLVFYKGKQGSCFLVDSLVFTAAHAVDTAYKKKESVDIHFFMDTEKSCGFKKVQAEVIICDTLMDIAIIKPINMDSIPVPQKYRLTLRDLELRNSQPKVEEKLVSFGFPGHSFYRVESYVSQIHVNDQYQFPTPDSIKLWGMSGSPVFFGNTSWGIFIKQDSISYVRGYVASGPLFLKKHLPDIFSEASKD